MENKYSSQVVNFRADFLRVIKFPEIDDLE